MHLNGNNQMKQWDISVLYVEDEKILRSIYKTLISPRVRSFELAENGEEGFSKYQQLQPDLVISDIKMPVMSGLDMAHKIRKQYPGARIIIMSAYGEALYFMRAIEIGVKAFLFKPVNSEKLFNLIDEQTREIKLESAMRYEEEKRRKAEEALRRNESILQAVSDISEVLLRNQINNETSNIIIARLGKATQVSRVYIFENFTSDGILYTGQRFEWVNEGIEAQIDNPELKAVPLNNSPFLRWNQILSQRQQVFGNVSDFPEQERDVLQNQGIVSIMAVPLFIDDHWHGFIGFDDCLAERQWTQVEVNSLEAAASILGAAFKRARIENELRSLNAELEERVTERTMNLKSEISERLIAEDMLRESEEKYRLIFENANEGIFLTHNAKIQFINPKAYEITGYLPKMVMGKPFTNFIHPSFREMVLDNHYRRLKGEDVPESYDIIILDARQRQKWVELKSNLITWDNMAAVLTFMTDIDTRKQYEKELELLNKHLEERVKQELSKLEKQQQALIQKSKLESLGELAAGMAHEINQPMGGITLSLDNILHELDSKSLSNDYLRSKIGLIFNDIERIRKLINHVRIFSRDHEKKSDVAFNINTAINNALMMINRKYIEHFVDMEVTLDEQGIILNSNVLRLEQVLLNLLSNAKYAVDKRQQAQKEGYSKRISLRSFKRDGHFIIEVMDNGIGISEENITRIFDPFFTTKEAEEGTGLGLSISYGIIKELGGAITADSVENEYTRVSIRLPLNERTSNDETVINLNFR
jgi:PAS domain S-box-containing protein